MISIIAVGLGGAIGALLRVGMNATLPLTIGNIPPAILVVNLLGSLCLGLFTGYYEAHGPASQFLRHFMVQGLLGGFTSFSAFALESNLLFEKGLPLTTLFYIAASVIGSIALFYIGMRLMRIA